MEDKQFDVLQNKLDKITKLLALSFLKEVEQEKEKIRLLDSMDFQPIEIARVLGKKPKTVRGELSRLRKSRRLQGEIKNQRVEN